MLALIPVGIGTATSPTAGTLWQLLVFFLKAGSLTFGSGFVIVPFLEKGFDRSEWRDALTQARDVHNEAETSYLMGTPLLADYLEVALGVLGYSLEDYQKGRL